MKRLYRFVITAFAVLFTTGCVDDPELETGIHNAKKPSVKTIGILKTTANSVSVSGEVLQENGAPVLESGFFWSTESSFSSRNKKAVSKRKGQFETTIENLTNDQDYYIRAYAVNEVDTAYGDMLPFKTRDGLGSIRTSLPLAIRSTSVVCGGVITKQGEAKVEERGVYLMRNAEPSDSDSIIPIRMEADSFYCTITDLKPETKYFYRAFAKSKYGEYNGAKIESFVTTDGLPVMDDAKFKLVSTDFDHATFAMTILQEGDYPVLVCGLCYSTKAAPTIEDADTIIVGKGIGEFQGELLDLEQHTEYFVRAYATNQIGTVYSAGDGIQTVLKNELPTVSTNEVKKIQNGTAHVGGKIVSEGASPVKESGVCWSTRPNPTLLDNEGKLALGSGDKVFSTILENLKGATTYHVRAYATNANGTQYGEDVAFSTPDIFTHAKKFEGGFRVPGSIGYCVVSNSVACVIGGDTGSSYTDEFWGYTRGEWQRFWGLPQKLAGLSCFNLGFGVLAFGGITESNRLNNHLYSYSAFDNKWSIVTPVDTCPKGMYRSAACSKDNTAYLIGGRRDTLTNEVWTFNVESNQWISKPNFPIKQFAGLSVIINDRIYAGLGIVNQTGISPTYTNKLWSSDLRVSVWTQETDFPATGLVSAIAYEDKIIAIDNEGVIWNFDTEEKTWAKKSQLAADNRKVHCMYMMHNKIYIGLGENSDTLIQYDPTWDN